MEEQVSEQAYGIWLKGNGRILGNPWWIRPGPGEKSNTGKYISTSEGPMNIDGKGCKRLTTGRGGFQHKNKVERERASKVTPPKIINLFTPTQACK